VRGVLRASGKAVWRWPPVVAADAGAMQIQLGKGRGLRCTEAALRSTALHSARPRGGWSKKVLANTVVEEAWRQICLAQRQRGMERAETRRAFVLGRVVSCSSDDLWRRTELDLGSSESFDDIHGSATVGAAIKIGSVFGGGSVLFRLWFWGCA
jgi:hypothetical protein